MKIIKKTLTLGELLSFPKVEGIVIPDNLKEITDEIVLRREEIFPGSTTEENYDYINSDWYGYHDYLCTDKFPALKFLFPVIAESLELVGANFKDYYFKSWINIWSKKQSINPHRHHGEWHGYYVLKDTGTLTYYTDGEIPTQRTIVPLTNYDGHFVMLPAHILHWAQKNPLDDWRVSMGYNISTWDQILLEEKDESFNRSGKLRNIILPLKDCI